MMARIAPLSRDSEDAGTAYRFLRRRFGADVEMGEDLPQGEWSRAYAFRHAGRELVVRFNPDPHVFTVDLLAFRYASPALPIPAILEVGELDGGHYAVSERAFGDFLEDLPPPEMEKTLPSLIATLDALRTAVTLQSTGYGAWDEKGDGRYRSWPEALLDVEAGTPGPPGGTWRRLLVRSTPAGRVFEDGMRELEGLASRCPNRRSLIHGDLLNRNVFVRAGRVSALIDWQCAMYGDPLYELAWFTFWAPWHAGVMAAGVGDRVLEHWRAAGVDLEGAGLRLRCYEIRIGVAHLVYNAWRGDLRNLEATARRTADVLG